VAGRDVSVDEIRPTVFDERPIAGGKITTNLPLGLAELTGLQNRLITHCQVSSCYHHSIGVGL
jgi:hypothetical protein